MSYCNAWAEVVFCGFPKKEMFTQILLCLFLEKEKEKKKKKKKKKKMNNSKSGYFRFDTFPTVQMDPFFNQT